MREAIYASMALCKSKGHGFGSALMDTGRILLKGGTDLLF